MELLDGTRLHVEADGSSTPRATVIFAHGVAVSLRTWDAQRALLFDPDVRRVFYDHRGFGHSTPWTGGRVCLRQLGADLGELVDAAPRSGPVTLVGHSMGTLVTIALAAVRPDLFESGRVTGVVLAAGPGIGSHIHAGLPRIALPTVQWGFPFLLDAVARLQLDRRMGSIPYAASAFLAHGRGASPILRRSLAQQVAMTPIDTVAAYLRACFAFDEQGAFETLGRAKVEIIHGTRDRLAAIRGARMVAAMTPGSGLYELAGAGHMVHSERAAEVNSIIAGLVGHPTVRSRNATR